MGNCFSASSSSHTSSSHESGHKKQLYLVEFELCFSAGHWGIFMITISDSIGTRGILWHIVLEDNGACKEASRMVSPRHGPNKSYACERKENYDMHRAMTDGNIFTMINGAYSTPRRMDNATQRVMSDFRYNLLAENCQSFIVDTLQTLRLWEPAMVSQSAIASMKAKPFVSVRASSRVRQKVQPRRAEMRARERGRFTSESENLAPRPVRRSDTRVQTPQSSRHDSGGGSSLFRSDIEVVPFRASQGNRLQKRGNGSGARPDPPVRSARMANPQHRGYRSEGHVQHRQMPGGWGYG